MNTAVTDPAGNQTTHEYDELARPMRIAYPNGTSEVYGYDPLGRAASATATGANGSILQKLSYECDKNSNPTQITDEDGVKSTYTYDELDRLVKESYQRRGYSYTYDDAAGKFSVHRCGKRATMTHRL